MATEVLNTESYVFVTLVILQEGHYKVYVEDAV